MDFSQLERAPLLVRVAALIASLAVFLLVLGAVLGLLETRLLALLPSAVVALVLAILALHGARALLARASVAVLFSSQSESSSGEHCRALALDLRSGRAEDASRELSKIIGERARRTSARYAVVTGLSGSLSRTVLAVLGKPEVVEHEYLVLKKLLPSAIPGLRALEESWICSSSLSEMTRRLSLGFGAPLVHSFPSPPPCSSDENSVVLGELLDFPGEEFRVSRADISKHVAVFGSTGSGKSTTLSSLAVAARKLGFSVLVLDWTGEYPQLLARAGAVFELLNPARGQASLNPLESVEDEEMLLNIMGKALSLTGPQSYLLVKAMEGEKPRSLRELETRLEELPEESKWDREVKRALLRKIALLTRGSYPAFSKTTLPELEGLKVVDMSSVRGWVARKSYALFMLATLFARREREGSGSPLLVVIDEAHNILYGEEQLFVEQLFAEARRYELSLAIATQSPSSIPNGVLLNANTKIVHALKSARDKTLIAETMSLPQEYLEVLDKLEPGVALAQTPSCSRALLLRVKLSN
ncbi:MAG: ATP-binding protein [Acidilobaceae archaeon]